MKTNGTAVIWSLTPELPPGLEFSKTYATLTGTSNVAWKETIYNITAKNRCGSASTLLKLSVSECPYGSFVFAKTEKGENGFLTISDGEVVYRKRIYSESPEPICIPYKDYSYEYNCTYTASPCSMTIQSEDGITYLNTGIVVKSITGQLKMAITEPPVITVPGNPVSVYVDEIVDIPVMITNAHGNVTFTPSLPSTTHFNTIRSSIQGSFASSGLFDFIINAENIKGEAHTKITIAVDVCPAGLKLIIFSRNLGTTTDHLLVSDGNNVIIYDHWFKFSDWRHNFCLTQGTYDIGMYSSSTQGGWYSDEPLLIADDIGGVFGTTNLDRGLMEQHQRLDLTDIISSGSTFRYHRGAVSGSWNDRKYKEAGWSDGKVDSWGNFESGVVTIYFRKHFGVTDPARHSLLVMDTLVRDGLIVRINGVEVSRRNMDAGEVNANTVAPRSYDILSWHRSTLRTSMLRKGDNIITIEVHRSVITAVTSKIEFDVHVFPSTTSCIFRSLNGKAYDDQEHPDPHHPAKMAFDLDSNTYWLATTLPTSLYYSFGSDYQSIVNRIDILKHNIYFSTASRFSVEGMVSQNVSEVLTVVDNTILLRGQNGVATILFENDKPFNTYRIVFYDSLNHTEVRIDDIRFFACNSIACKKQWKTPSIATGETYYGKCPIGYIGAKRMQCVDEDNTAIWRKNTSSCVPLFPHQRISFIDIKFRVYNISAYIWDWTIVGGLRDIIVKELYVKNKEISFPFAIDVSSNHVWMTDVYMRFTLDGLLADYVFKTLDDFIIRLNDLLYEKFKVSFPTIFVQITSGPVLRNPFPTAIVVIATTIVMIIIIVLSTYFYVRSGKGQHKNLKKSLLKGTSVEKSSLIDNSA